MTVDANMPFLVRSVRRAGAAIPAMLALLPAALAPTPAAAVPVAQEEGAPPVEVWQLDQLQLPRDTAPHVIKALEPAHSLDAVIAILKRYKVPYRRVQTEGVPDRLPEAVRAQLLTLPRGEPFIMPEPDFISVSVIRGRKLPASAAAIPLPTREA